MDKNNDIQVNKVNKWDYGIVDMSLWHLKDEFDALVDKLNGVYGIDVFEIEELTGDTYSSMDKVLERFNELEAVHQKECGMISQYEEENRSLRRDLKNENDRLRNRCNELAFRACKYSWAIRTVLKKASFSPGHVGEELRLMARKSTTPKDVYERWEGIADELLGGRAKEEKEDTLKKMIQEVTELEKEKFELEEQLAKQKQEACVMISQYEEKLRIREKEKDAKDKLNDELKQQIKDLESRNRVLKLRTNMMFGCYGLNSKYGELNKKIQTLEKENKDLKDLLEKDGEFGNSIGKRIADSIREGCDKGVYKLHPLTRIDIHVEETNNMPIDMPFGRYAIPRISVMFNNTQTEMERDTAEHECNELNGKINSLWRVIEDLNRKIKELEKENNNLTTDTKRLSDAVEAWFNMFNDMRHKRDFLKKENEKLKETNKFLDGEGYF